MQWWIFNKWGIFPVLLCTQCTFFQSPHQKNQNQLGWITVHLSPTLQNLFCTSCGAFRSSMLHPGRKQAISALTNCTSACDEYSTMQTRVPHGWPYLCGPLSWLTPFLANVEQRNDVISTVCASTSIIRKSYIWSTWYGPSAVAVAWPAQHWTCTSSVRSSGSHKILGVTRQELASKAAVLLCNATC